MIQALLFTLMSMGAQAQTIQPGDLAILFPRPNTAAQTERFMALKDFELAPQDLQAILAHASKKLMIQSEFDRDQHLRKKRSPDDLLQNKCFLDVGKWRLTAIRIAPFEYSLPGSRRNLAAYAAAKNIEGMDRVFQFRLTFNPICAGTAVDVGLHVIYDTWPENSPLRNRLVQSRDEFLRTDKAEALDLHLKALTSADYKSFHQGLIQKFEALAQKRKTSASPAMVSLYQEAEQAMVYGLSYMDWDVGDVVERPPEADRISTPLQWVGNTNRFQNEEYYAALKIFVAEFSRRQNLERMALNVLEMGDSWFLAGLVPTEKVTQTDIFTAKDKEKAKKTFATLFPQELKTQQAVMDKPQNLHIRDISTSGFYAQVNVLAQETPGQPGVRILDQKLYEEVDFYGQPTEFISELRPNPPPGEIIPLNRLLNDVSLSNATTTTCATCHAMTLSFMTKNKAGQIVEDNEHIFGAEPQANVRMMGIDRFGSVTLRSITVNEVAADYKKLVNYLKTGP